MKNLSEETVAAIANDLGIDGKPIQVIIEIFTTSVDGTQVHKHNQWTSYGRRLYEIFASAASIDKIFPT